MTPPSLTDVMASQLGLATVLSITIALALLIWFGASTYLSKLPHEKTQLAGLSDIRAMLSPASKPLPLLLQERAVPNARLTRAFGITNTFVSSDVGVHASFVREARSLIRVVEGDGWPRLAEHAILAAEICVQEQTNFDGKTAFDSVMQNTALHVILTTLFEVPAEDISVEDLSIVAKGINDLWRLSKLTDELPAHLLPDVNTRLRRWIPSQSNPLNFIVPAFETMWRVVATTVAFVHNDPAALAVLSDYLAIPSRRQFETFEASGPNLPSVEAIVTESIRLHPPTRRISRQPRPPRSWFGLGGVRMFVADIGTLHRDVSIWGVDADVYDPMRHHPTRRTLAQTQASMGFGVGRLKCVASAWAPQAAGVIVAAICGMLERGMSIEEGQRIGGREGWEGWTVEYSQ